MEFFTYGDGGVFKQLRWMENLRQSTWDHEIWHADSSSDARLVLKRPRLRETKNMNMAGR
jgi:hypothetical protein